MKRLLFVAYLFPPVGGLGSAGSQRAAKFVRYLPEFDWAPVVLTGKLDTYESYLKFDESLSEKVPAEVRVVRTSVFRLTTKLLVLRRRILDLIHKKASQPEGAHGEPELNTPDAVSGRSERGYQRLKDSITDLFEIPDAQAGWIIPAVIRGWRLHRNEPFDVVLATGRPWSALVIGLLLSRLIRRPLVADFRDPWMTNPFRERYSPIKQWLETKLEHMVVRGPMWSLAIPKNSVESSPSGFQTSHLRSSYRY